MIYLGKVTKNLVILCNHSQLNFIVDTHGNHHHGVTRHGQRGDGAEGIDHGGVGVGDEDHVALLDHGVAVVGGIKADATLHGVLREVLGGDGDVTVLAVDVHHLEVHHADVLFLDKLDDVLNLLIHMKILHFGIAILRYFNAYIVSQERPFVNLFL